MLHSSLLAVVISDPLPRSWPCFSSADYFAHHLLDVMLQGVSAGPTMPNKGARLKEGDAGAASAADRLSDLPADLLYQVLSFLPPRDAVRTCLLSTAWRRLWESATRFDFSTAEFASKAEFTRFVDNRLLRRGGTPSYIDTFCIRSCRSHDFLDHKKTNLWVHHALVNDARAIGISYRQTDWFLLDHDAFTSAYLKELHLVHVSISTGMLEKLCLGCPVLEGLEVTGCIFEEGELSCSLLRNLIVDARVVNDDDHLVDTLSLLMLRLEGGVYCTPYIGSMPSLATACLYLDDWTFSDLNDRLDVFSALSGVSELKLFSTTGKVVEEVLTKSLEKCSIFHNLVSMTLSDWCVANECKGLIYLLSKSPSLQRLTLKFDEFCQTVFTPTARSFNCGTITNLEIECRVGDTRIDSLVTMLRANAPSLKMVHLKLVSIVVEPSEIDGGA